MRYTYLYILSACTLLSCSDTSDESAEAIKESTVKTVSAKSGFELLNAEEVGISFVNQIDENEAQNHLVWDAVYYGGGVAIGDLNNDGLQDVYFTGNQKEDEIYINQGDWQFDRLENSGIEAPGTWSNGVSLIDVNADGYKDIYVCKSGWLEDTQMVDLRRNKLYINNGDLTFTEQAQKFGLDNEGFSTQSTWLDYDKDGDLDMFLLNAPSNNINYKANFYSKNGFPSFCADKFYRNDGNGKFEEISQEVGVSAMSYGLGVIAKDLNHDGWIDIYVANDYERPDYFYINQGDGTFKNQLNDKVKHTSYTAMGIDAGDINNDCLVDLTVLDMQSESHFRSKTNMPTMQPEVFWSWVNKGYNYQYSTNTLQLNNGVGFFSDISQLAGIASTDWSWSVLCEDFNDDSFADIYITNGINRDIQNNDFALKFEELNKKGQKIDLFEFAKETPSNKIPNYFFENNGDLTFTNKTGDYKMAVPSFSYGSATGDLDGDGHMDLVVNNNNMPPFIYKNTSENHWLNIEIEGTVDDPDALGTKAVIFYNGEKQYREMTTVRGYQSCSQPLIHFGLGQETEIDSLLVLFPNGKSIKKQKIKADQKLTIRGTEAINQDFDVYGSINRYFNDISSLIEFKHDENTYDDFEKEILLPHKQTKIGPFAAVGDVNNDGFEDVFIGGAAGQSGGLFLQMIRKDVNSSVFKQLAGPWKNDKQQEDMGCEFFDIEGDGDLDLYVVSGGGHLADGDRDYTDRIYINDGEGNFSKAEWGEIGTNGSCVIHADIDNDGDVDLFVGGRGTPNYYPSAQESFLLINTEGRFEKIQNDDIANYCGLVTDAEWFDFDGDNDLDLMVVGEWMAPTLFENNQGVLAYSELNSQWVDRSGWWYHVSKADVDQDGKMDLLLGNIGQNNKFHVSEKKPLRVYQNDFDGNKTNDIILAKISDGDFVPVRGRECSSEQVPFVSDQFENYESFAEASIEEVYGEGLNEALLLEVKEFRSGIFHNTGEGFEFLPFPNMAQIAPVTGALMDDFDQDGFMDILIAGNYFDAEVETTKHDAGNGLILRGDGSLNFSPSIALFTGFYAPGNVKGIYSLKITGPEESSVLICNNDGQTKLFSY